jgi:hypothetical protein
MPEQFCRGAAEDRDTVSRSIEETRRPEIGEQAAR